MVTRSVELVCRVNHVILVGNFPTSYRPFGLGPVNFHAAMISAIPAVSASTMAAMPSNCSGDQHTSCSRNFHQEDLTRYSCPERDLNGHVQEPLSCRDRGDASDDALVQ
jgi:hypothetical protein